MQGDQSPNHKAVIIQRTPRDDGTVLHVDGMFFAALWVFTWVIFFGHWAWNYKPKSQQHPRKREPWEMPHGRN
jgi:hypothetical protein